MMNVLCNQGSRGRRMVCGLLVGWGFCLAGLELRGAVVVSVMELPAAATYADPPAAGGIFGEDVAAFSDRLHQWNGVSTDVTRRQPTFAGLGLVGETYVQMANDARAVSATSGAYQVTLGEEAQVFLLIDTRQAVPAWVASMGFERVLNGGTDGEYRVGYDEGSGAADLGVGPGLSINTQAAVFTARLGAGVHVFNGLGFAGNNNYGLVTTRAGTVVGGVARAGGGNPTPALLRLGFASGVTAFVDRTHQFVVTSTVLAAVPGLAGADFVQTSNDARAFSATTALYEVTLLEDATAFLILDNRIGSAVPAWIGEMGFVSTGQTLGIDEGGDGSINQTATIYQAQLGAGIWEFNGLEFGGGLNHYGLAFSAVPEPGRALLGALGLMGILTIRRRRRR
ncbi:hypothetical protein [Phragmitibacter flavus]|uniref:hypothetical protein n=1 Tax=Phragmitibacter flavus TaxID=2576071 RepID=UPI0010FD3469|nr:hypothetical protein [Phragmitibacter flavus]